MASRQNDTSEQSMPGPEAQLSFKPANQWLAKEVVWTVFVDVRVCVRESLKLQIGLKRNWTKAEKFHNLSGIL